jgi:hypothetical protein
MEEEAIGSNITTVFSPTSCIIVYFLLAVLVVPLIISKRHRKSIFRP